MLSKKATIAETCFFEGRLFNNIDWLIEVKWSFLLSPLRAYTPSLPAPAFSTSLNFVETEKDSRKTNHEMANGGNQNLKVSWLKTKIKIIPSIDSLIFLQ